MKQRVANALRAHWPALSVTVAGGIAIVLVSISGAGTGLVMVAGAIVGVLIGGAATLTRRHQGPPT